MILQMNRALGMFEAQSKLWRLASMAQSSGAPVSKWATREIREGQLHVWFHCVGIRVSDQLEKIVMAQRTAHYCHLGDTALAQ